MQVDALSGEIIRTITLAEVGAFYGHFPQEIITTENGFLILYVGSGFEYLYCISLNRNLEKQWSKRLKSTSSFSNVGFQNRAGILADDEHCYIYSDFTLPNQQRGTYLAKLQLNTGDVAQSGCDFVEDYEVEISPITLFSVPALPLNLAPSDVVFTPFDVEVTVDTLPLTDICTEDCPEYCGNGLDDDGDGLVDCCDPDLADAPCCAGFVPLEIGPAGQDSVLACTFAPLLLDPSGSYPAYTWQDGSTDSVYLVTQPGTYVLTVPSDRCGGTQTDTLYVSPGDALTESRIEKCPGDTVLVFDVPVAAPGLYTRELSTADGCDSLLRVEVVDLAIPDLTLSAQDTCVDGAPAARLLPTSPTAVAYSWSTGATTSELLAAQADTYSLTVTDAQGCTASADLSIELLEALLISLGEPRSDCAGETSVDAEVSGGIPPYTFAWSNGETTATATRLPPGEATLTVTDALGCSESTVLLIEATTAAEPRFANVLLPDDAENNRFRPVFEEADSPYEVAALEVYNRWGQLLYSDQGPQAAWDGTHRGTAVPTGVYVYRVRIVCDDGLEREYSGDLTVLY